MKSLLLRGKTIPVSIIVVWKLGSKVELQKKARETNLSVDWLIEQILDGKITKSNILLTDDYYAIYGQHKRKVNEALDTAGERKSYRAIADLEVGSFKKTIFLSLLRAE